MASRDGATVAGTDGSDFSHRERVVSQYHTSGDEPEAVAEDAQVVEDLPLANDYTGIGGPQTVPLESEGAFEKPSALGQGYRLLNDLFMAPSQDTIKSFQFTERKRLIARTKSLLSKFLYLHVFLALVLLAKLCPNILDRMDIFVLALEELNVPKPQMWEWIWLGGTMLIFLVGANAMKASKVGKMKIFAATVFAVGLLPIFFAVGIFWSDASAYLFDPQSKVYETWKGFPVAILWDIFAIAAINVHFFELYYAYVLMDAWNIKRKTN